RHLRGIAAEDVYAEQLQVVGGNQQLQHAVGVAGDLAAGQFAIPGHTDLVGHRLLGQIDLSRADIGDLRDRVDADRLQGSQAVYGLAERVAGRHAALVHRGRRQRGKADDVADGVDVVDLGLEQLVDEDPAAGIGLQPGVAKFEVFGLALPAGRVHHRFGGDLLAAGQAGDGARRADLNAGHLLAETERDRQVAQVEAQRLDDLGGAEV